jgi:hypothetical protein
MSYNSSRKSTVKTTTGRKSTRTTRTISPEAFERKCARQLKATTKKTAQQIRDSATDPTTPKAAQVRAALLKMTALLLSTQPGAGELAASLYQGIASAWDANRREYGDPSTDERECATQRSYDKLLAALRG